MYEFRAFPLPSPVAGFACMVALKARAAARLTALFLFLFFFVFITFSSAGRDSSSWETIQQEKFWLECLHVFHR